MSVEDLVNAALAMGADYADARYELRFSSVVVASNERIESISIGTSRGIGVRVVANGAVGFVSTNLASDVDLGGFRRVLEGVIRSVRKAGERKEEKVVLAPVPSCKDRHTWRFLVDPRDVDASEKVEIVLDATERAREFNERIANATAAVLDSLVYKRLVTSEGTDLETLTPRVAVKILVVASEEGSMGSCARADGGIGGYELLREISFESLVEDACERAIKMLKAKPPPSGRFTVIADSELTGVFIHEAVGHAVEGDLVIAGNSVLKDKLGERIASELVTIVDDPTIEGKWGSYKYDDEGVRASKKVLVERGVLVNYILNREAARKLGLEPNGGGRARDFSSPPLARMSNTYLERGDWTLEEMLEDVDYGVYLRGSRGGEVDTARGSFQFNAAEAYLVERGELTTALRGVSLSGLVLETLANIDAVGRDLKLKIGTCVKGGQSIPVSNGGPHIRIENAVVGGVA